MNARDKSSLTQLAIFGGVGLAAWWAGKHFGIFGLALVAGAGLIAYNALKHMSG
jgi:hypothetical protein